MKANSLLALALLTTSCGTELCTPNEPTETENFSVGNVIVEPRSFPIAPTHIEEAISLVGKLLVEKVPAYSADEISQALETFPLTIEYFDSLPGVLGQHIGQRIKLAYISDCPGETSLAHELIHYFGWATGHGSDHDHIDTRLWASSNSVEGLAEASLISQFCACP